MEFGAKLTIEETPIPGLLVVRIPVHGDSRGWFKENWQREAMIAAGLPDFGPVQNNMSHNVEVGIVRGIHAEPWDKLVSVAHGRVFGAWVDLREGDSFGSVFTTEIDPSVAVFVPRGVGNSFQTLEPETVYSYLVNDHWSADAQSRYTFLNLADETVAVPWPLPLDEKKMSAKDLAHPRLADVTPMESKRTLVTGAGGQLGRALREVLPDAHFVTRSELDLTDSAAVDAWPWRDYDRVINAAAYTKVDEAETPAGRLGAWAANATAVGRLARVSAENQITLVHVSSDYVFDGTHEVHTEEEALAPLGVYGQSKAAGDVAVATVPRHYLLRTSWVVGDGGNFVKTMASLAERGIDPSVVDDQVGRLTFTADLAAAIVHLLSTDSPYGTYNVSNSGAPRTWADIASRVFEILGHDANRVTGVSTEEFFAGKSAAPRPRNSVFDLSKIEATGFSPRDGDVALVDYLGAR
ncbi:sugar nucleotide-binding protein [Amnibacterium flavum]|uniref:dTDP-4-dehydrorhamnose reductase n=1 Tax=Amnibacterium flavum TaxID=2173173 RepID=A0A2V1HTG0_9MICO|nr:bifunctional dTDP-4-dehydrorhamnose 3,5-epimerase family protein/NAD(P)-dependent oxidoreductase [Amnibacterium flavum]PVZ95875.1 dTDP-4-dehydrorhamnose reductase [Amnibacterium flavum]